MSKITEKELIEIREFLIPKWLEKQTELSKRKGMLRDLQYGSDDDGMCRFTALFMSKLLTNRTGVKWAVAGGDVWEPEYPTGGFKDCEGNWNGHYWLTDGKQILDITAEQFGYASIVITTVDDPRYENNYSKKELADHLKHAKDTVGQWLKSSRELLSDFNVSSSELSN